MNLFDKIKRKIKNYPISDDELDAVIQTFENFSIESKENEHSPNASVQLLQLKEIKKSDLDNVINEVRNGLKYNFFSKNIEKTENLKLIIKLKTFLTEIDDIIRKQNQTLLCLDDNKSITMRFLHLFDKKNQKIKKNNQNNTTIFDFTDYFVFFNSLLQNINNNVSFLEKTNSEFFSITRDFLNKLRKLKNDINEEIKKKYQKNEELEEQNKKIFFESLFKETTITQFILSFWAFRMKLEEQLRYCQKKVELLLQLEDSQEEAVALEIKLQDLQEKNKKVDLLLQLENSQEKAVALEIQLQDCQGKNKKVALAAQLEYYQKKVDLLLQLKDYQEEIVALKAQLEYYQKKVGLLVQLQDCQEKTKKVASAAQLKDFQEKAVALATELKWSQEKNKKVELAAQLKDSQEEVVTLKAKLEDFQEKAVTLAAQLKDSQEKTELVLQLEDSQEEVVTLKAKLEDSQEKAVALEIQLQDCQEKNKKVALAAQLKDFQEKEVVLAAQLKNSQEKIELLLQLKDSQGKNKKVALALQLKDSQEKVVALKAQLKDFQEKEVGLLVQLKDSQEKAVTFDGKSFWDYFKLIDKIFNQYLNKIIKNEEKISDDIFKIYHSQNTSLEMEKIKLNKEKENEKEFKGNCENAKNKNKEDQKKLEKELETAKKQKEDLIGRKKNIKNKKTTYLKDYEKNVDININFNNFDNMKRTKKWYLKELDEKIQTETTKIKEMDDKLTNLKNNNKRYETEIIIINDSLKRIDKKINDVEISLKENKYIMMCKIKKEKEEWKKDIGKNQEEFINSLKVINKWEDNKFIEFIGNYLEEENMKFILTLNESFTVENNIKSMTEGNKEIEDELNNSFKKIEDEFKVKREKAMEKLETDIINNDQLGITNYQKVAEQNKQIENLSKEKGDMQTKLNEAIQENEKLKAEKEDILQAKLNETIQGNEDLFQTELKKIIQKNKELEEKNKQSKKEADTLQGELEKSKAENEALIEKIASISGEFQNQIEEVKESEGFVELAADIINININGCLDSQSDNDNNDSRAFINL